MEQIEFVEIGAGAPSLSKSRIKSEPLGMKYTIKIEEDLGEPREWADELDIIRGASPFDVVHLQINSGGGNYYVAIAFIHALRECQAHVVCEVVGCAQSAASAIMLQAQEWILHDMSEAFIHQSQLSGISGSQSKVKNAMDFSSKQTRRFVENAYKDFLYEDEIEKILNDDEIYLNMEEIGERLEFLSEMRYEEDKETTENGILESLGAEGIDPECVSINFVGGEGTELV